MNKPTSECWAFSTPLKEVEIKCIGDKCEKFMLGLPGDGFICAECYTSGVRGYPKPVHVNSCEAPKPENCAAGAT